MTFTNRTHKESKAEIKAQFLYFFKTLVAKHLATKNLKTSSQTPTESVWEYDKRWKDLINQLEYVIDKQLLIQWFLIGLSQKIRWHICLETFKMYEDALTKAMQVEIAKDFLAYPMDTRLKEQLEIMQK